MPRDFTVKHTIFWTLFQSVVGLAAAGLVICGCGRGGAAEGQKEPVRIEETADVLAEPQEETIADPREAAPDFVTAEGWLRRPDGAAREHEADVIFFVSTVYDDAEGPRWGQFGATPEGVERARVVCASTADCFDGVADLWIPMWRQLNRATLAATKPAYARAALALADSPARQDVFAALDAYFAEADESRPFLLAGHGQGAEMVKIVISDYLPKHPGRAARMVAAYIAGTPVTETFLRANQEVARAAEAADDTGVIVSWNTEGGGNLNVDDSDAFAPGNVAINPLLWTTTTTPVPASLNEGSMMPSPDGGFVPVRPGPADATINPFHGTIICTTFLDMPELRSDPALFGPDSFHDLDYALYFFNLRSNAAARISAFLRK